MSLPQLDDLDRQLIDVLAKDARVSNRRIAADLGVTEGTVRGRIKRLQEERLIAFTAITGFGINRAARLAFVGVQAQVDDVRSVAQAIAEVPQVNAVMVTMGQFNILAICLFDELENLVLETSDRILALPGVHHVETSIAVKTFKYDPRVVRITAASAPAADAGDDA